MIVPALRVVNTTRGRIASACCGLLMLGAATPITIPSSLFGVDGLTITGAGTWTGVTMLGLYMLREWRETRKLSADDRQARREGYAKQVENLQGENRKLREDLRQSEQRHDSYRHACQQETDQLRENIRSLEDEINGLRRRIDTQGLVAARAVSEHYDSPITKAKFGEQLARLDQVKGTGE